MESLDNQLLEVRPDIVMTMRKMYNLDKPEDMERAIDALEEWLKKQYHLTTREYPRDFLERSIIFMKGSVEKAKSQIDNICSMRSIFPKFFEKFDTRNDFNTMDSITYCTMLPKLTKDHYRVYLSYCHSDGITSEIFLECFRYGILKCEYIKAHDYCNGFIALLDYRKINLFKLIPAINLIDTSQILKILMEGYGMRIKGIHILTPSKAAEIFVNIIKPMLGTKVGSRIHVHTNIETLYDFVPKDVLPCELGGELESIAVISDRWKETLAKKENIEYFRKMSEAVSIEAYRIKEQLNLLDLGTAGTFRSLTVD